MSHMEARAFEPEIEKTQLYLTKGRLKDIGIAQIGTGRLVASFVLKVAVPTLLHSSLFPVSTYETDMRY